MASDASSVHSDESSSSEPYEPTMNLQVVSPSVGVTRPILFPDIVTSTTIKELKDRIRESLPLRPSDEQQRLIHRGRALSRDTDTLEDIFKVGAVSKEQITAHAIWLTKKYYVQCRMDLPNNTPFTWSLERSRGAKYHQPRRQEPPVPFQSQPHRHTRRIPNNRHSLRPI